MTSGDLLADGALALAFFGGFLLVLVSGAAVFESTERGRHIADWFVERLMR